MPHDDVPPGWPRGFGESPDDREALLVLASLRGITPRRLHALGWQLGTAGACVAAVRGGRAGSEADREWAGRTDPGEVANALRLAGASLLAPHDDAYPRELDDLQHDPPGWLFLRGAPLRPGALRVAVVGSRRCSALGRELSYDIGRRVAGAGVGIVSGAADGIDGAAHRGALAASGPTVAVLGSGIDVAYPGSNAELIERIAATGTVVSEYPPGVPAEPHHFPARNRIVAALARALVVVEGAAKSGSRISVDHALDLGRDVFALPGPVTSPLAETPLEIIREGAIMIRGADDLLADMGVAGLLALEPPPDLPPHLARAYGALSGPSLPEAVARTANLSIPEAVSALVSLELRGLVRSVGGRYERRLAQVAK